MVTCSSSYLFSFVFHFVFITTGHEIVQVREFVLSEDLVHSFTHETGAHNLEHGMNG